MSNAHGHSHGGEGHAHAHAPAGASLAGDPRARRALTFALALGLIVLVVEVAAGILYDSLALLSDAVHMLTDVSAYGVALWAAHAAMRPASARRTFGHGRIEIIAALANAATLLAASAWILFEAVSRLLDPHEVDGVGMSTFALVGLVANLLAFAVLWRAGSSSLNMRGALLHAAGDLLGSVAAVTAGVVIALTGWNQADPIASIALTLLIVVGAWRLLRVSVDVLLDSAPAGADATVVGAALVEVAGVVEVHDVHVWTMSPGQVAASAHVRVIANTDAAVCLDALEAALRDAFDIAHTTFQLRVDRGTVPVDTVPLMSLEDAIDWATDHVARANPDLSRAVIAAAAGAAALGMGADGRVSPVSVSSRTLDVLGRRPGANDVDA